MSRRDEMSNTPGTKRTQDAHDAKRANRTKSAPATAAAWPSLPLSHPASLAVAAVATLCVLFSVTFQIHEPDFWQHLTVGREIWRAHAIPTTQIWTWPTYGAPDVNSSWGFRAILYPFWAAAGVWGLFAWRWLVGLGAFALLVGTARRMGVRGLAPYLVAVISALAWRERSQIRPETWVAILIALELWILETRRHGGRDHSPWLVAIAWVWANSHISYHLGFAILGAYGLDAWVHDRRPPWKLIGIGVLGLAASFANPFGWRALWWPFDFALHQRHEPIYVTIGELEPPRWSENLWNGAPLLVFGWPLLLIARARKAGIDIAEAIIAALFVTFTLMSVRFLGLLAIVATPFLARDAEDVMGPLLRRPALAAPWTRAALTIAACIALGIPVWRSMHPGVGIEWRYYPVRAADFMAEHGVRGRGYNTFSQGGYLLWRFFPERDRLPFMDIHQAGTPQIRRLYTFSLEKPEYWRELDQKFRFEWALLARLTFAADRLPDIIEADSSWALVFQDDAAMLFVRRDGPLRGIAERFGYRVVPAGNQKLGTIAPALGRDPALRAAFRAELERTTRESPYTAQAHTLLANLALVEGRIGDARAELGLALAANPWDEQLRKQVTEMAQRTER